MHVEVGKNYTHFRILVIGCFQIVECNIQQGLSTGKWRLVPTDPTVVVRSKVLHQLCFSLEI